MTRTRGLIVLIVLLVSVAACGNDSDSDDAGDTTTTTAAVTTTTEQPGVKGPVGDAALLPALLEPSDYGPGLVTSVSSDDVPKTEYCPGVPFSTKWTGIATSSVEDDGTGPKAGVSESVLQFAPGDAETFTNTFPLINEKCRATGLDIELAPVTLGDGGFRGAPPAAKKAESLPIEVVVVRVGDRVVSLVAIAAKGPLLTDEVVNKAVEKARAA